eukprot:5612301-Pyramimonas_sp.AAC.1
MRSVQLRCELQNTHPRLKRYCCVTVSTRGAAECYYCVTIPKQSKAHALALFRGARTVALDIVALIGSCVTCLRHASRSSQWCEGQGYIPAP